MGNLVKSQKEIQKNLDQIMSSQVQESPNVLIKQSKSGNVEIIKLNMQISNAEISYESTDKIQVELTISSNRNFQLIAYTFVTETRTTKQSRYDRSMQQSTTQSFKCPAGSHFQFPPQHLEFMIVDLLKFQKLKVNPDAQYHNLVIEMKALKPSNVSIIYFYRIDCDENNYHCQLHNSKEIVIFNNRIYEIHELFGIKNTPFNPVWNPNTIEDKECIICFFNMINTVLLPCKHMCTCSVCADHIIMNQKIRQCPLCRIDLDNYLTLEIKDKARKDEQQRQFQVEQQKYYDAIKEKKQEQALKQSSIMEQLQSKVKENQEAERLRQEKLRNIQMFDGIDDFHENQENFPYAEEASVESNEEPENIEDNQENQFNNAPSGKLEQISEEEANRHSLEDDKQKYSANQRSSYDVKHEKTSITSAKQQQQSENPKLFKSHSLKGRDSPGQNTNPFDYIDELTQHRRSLQQPIIQQQQQQFQLQNMSPQYIRQEPPSFNQQQQFLLDSYDQISNQFEHSSNQMKENVNKSVDFSQHSKSKNIHNKINSMNLDLIDIFIDQPQLKQEIKNNIDELFVYREEEQVNCQFQDFGQEKQQEQKSIEQEQGVQGQVSHSQQQSDQVSLIVFD